MSSYDKYDRRRRPLYGPTPSRRSSLGYWIPLVLTITVATAGLAAWVWSERKDGDDEEDYTSDEHERPDYPPRQHSEGSQQQPGYSGQQDPRSQGAEGSRSAEDEGLIARMSGAIRRSPSPQQFFDSAGKQFAAGVAAAGAAVGGALGSIREEGGNGRQPPRGGAKDREDGFSDHERWSEEAVGRRAEEERRSKATSSGKGATKERSRKTVAIVVSADTSPDSLHHEEDPEYRTEHASILSHLPQYFDPSTTGLLVLIYAPHLTSLPSAPQPSRPESGLSSSYATISTPAQTPGEERSPTYPTQPVAEGTGDNNPPNATFDALYTQALALVDKPSMILPFTTRTGYVHMLRHLAPSIVYVSDSPALSGAGGETIGQLRGWVGQTVVVVGDEGHGGLADTETETEDEGGRAGGKAGRRDDEWWEKSDMVGLGKGVEIVDAGRVGDDWSKRVGGRE